MKKIITLLSVLFLAITATFAMPGFTSYFEDTNGSFVYYRDYTFARESYIGLLKYSDTQYAIRYYAPEDTEQKLTDKVIEIIFSINPDKPYIELSGEIASTKISNSQEDIDILNYLHDIIYEFSSRRIKAGDVSPNNKEYVLNKDYRTNGLKVTQTYEQFGGNVIINFDCLIPFFNIKSIESSNGKKLFDCVAIGIINNQNDTCFNDFIPYSKVKTLEGTALVDEKAKSLKVSSKNNTITLDEKWTKISDDVYYYELGEAFAILGNLQTDQTNSSDYTNTILSFIKTLITSRTDVYYYLPDFNYSFTTTKTQFDVKAYSPKDNYKSHQFYIVSKKKNDICFFNLVVSEKNYTEYKNYYNKIIKSYK